MRLNSSAASPSSAVSLPMQVVIDDAIEIGSRFDVQEVVSHFGPLVMAATALPDRIWTLHFALVGITELKGERVTDNKSQIQGVLPTYPSIPMEVKLRLSGHTAKGACLFVVEKIILRKPIE